jgi:hypothetical protein
MRYGWHRKTKTPQQSVAKPTWNPLLWVEDGSSISAPCDSDMPVYASSLRIYLQIPHYTACTPSLRPVT